MRDRSVAFEQALSYTGFGRLPEAKKLSPDKAVTAAAAAVDSTTPFLSEYINGRPVWQVTFDSLFFDLPWWMPDAIKGQTIKTFTVSVDSATGQLLRVSGYAVDGRRSEVPLLTAETATKVLTACGEQFTDFPHSMPKVDLLTALNQAVASQPLAAPELHIWLVNWAHMGEPPIPVWMIIGTPVRGELKSQVVDTPELEDGFLERVRSIVDATTGQARAFTNTP